MRYTTRPRSKHDEVYFYPPPVIGHIDAADHDPINTGLLDHQGNVIWREPRSIGFHRPGDNSEW